MYDSLNRRGDKIKNEEGVRTDIIHSMDSFIDNIQNIRKILLGISVSGIFLAPFAAGLSMYLLFHPKFFVILEEHDDFGSVLTVFFAGIFVVSGIWMYFGLKEYRQLNNWNNRYSRYLKKREKIEEEIASQYNLDEEK